MPFEHAGQIFFGFSSRYAESRRCQKRMPPNRRTCISAGHIGQMIEMKRAGNRVLPERVVPPRKVRMDRLVERRGGQVRADIDAGLFRQSGRVDAHTPQHTGRANAALTPVTVDRHMAVILPA